MPGHSSAVRVTEERMDPGAVIIGLAVTQFLCLVAIGVIAWALAARGRDAARRVKAAVTPAARARARGLEGVRLARGKAERIVLRGKGLSEDLSRKWRTAVHLVEEVVHPGRPAVESVTEPIDRGRRLARRLSRLQAAARKAAGSRQ